MSRLGFMLLLTVLLVAGTVAIGWWSLPLICAASGLLLRRQRPLFVPAALSGAVAWLLLLAFDAVTGEAGRLAASAGAVLGIPGWAFTSLTVMFASLLSGCAALSAQYVALLATRNAG